MSNNTTDREKALAWWDSLMSYQKYGLSYNIVSKNKELSFSEIEAIWNKQGNPTPTPPLTEEGEEELKCTPGEWHLSPNDNYIRANGVHGWNIATIEDQPPYTKGNAQRIITAVNCHDDLVKALTAVYRDIELNNVKGGSDELNIMVQTALIKASTK